MALRPIIALAAIGMTFASATALAATVKSGTTTAPDNAVEAKPPPRAPAPHELAAMRLVFDAQGADKSVALDLIRRALAMVPEPGEVRGNIACMYAHQLMRATNEGVPIGRIPGLVSAADECYRLLPAMPGAQIIAGIVKIETGQGRLGGRMLLTALKSVPTIATTLDSSGTLRHLRLLEYQGERELAKQISDALADGGFAKDQPSLFSSFAADRILRHLQAKDNDRAIAILPQIFDVDTGLAMLIDRRYAEIWPSIEEWAGGTFERQRDALLATVRKTYELDPSLENRRTYAVALWKTGSHDLALSTLGEAIKDTEKWDDDRFHILSAATAYFRMLAQLGRAEEAIEEGTRLIRANPVDKFAYAANLMPNLARLMIANGHPQQALDLIAAEYPPETVVESDAAYGFYAALRYCAFLDLNQTARAAEQKQLLLSRYAENRLANDIANGCATDDATILSTTIARFNDPDQRAGALLDYYRAIRNVAPSVTELGHSRMKRLWRSDLQLAREFEKLGRELPASFEPALRSWEQSGQPAVSKH